MVEVPLGDQYITHLKCKPKNSDVPHMRNSWRAEVLDPADAHLPGQITKSRRRSHTKVATGCSTCKRRHLKCDETLPVCRRCTKAGLGCTRYAAPQPILFDYEASVEERRRIHFFTHRTVPSIEVYNSADREFWTHTIIQASHVGTSLRHAVLSIEAYHESLTDTQNSASHLQYAQSQYSKAIRTAAAAHYDSTGSSLGELLVLSIALRSIEVFRNQLDNAFVHLNAARAVLDTAAHSNTHSDLIDALLRPMIVRFEYKSMPVSTITNGDIAAGEGSIERAREKGHAILSLVCHGTAQTTSTALRRDNFIRQVLPICGTWYKEVVSVTKRLPRSGPVMETAIYAKIQFFLLMAALRLGSAENEMAFDGLKTAFQNLICLCEECAAAGNEQSMASKAIGSDASSIRLSIGAELVATAFFVGSCCRDVAIRRRALRFLESSKRREPRWYSPHAAAVLAWLIHEEEDVYEQSNAKSRRIKLKSLQYFHDLDAMPLEPKDPAWSFQMPTWIRIEYAYASEPLDLQEYWINVENSEGSIPDGKNTPKPTVSTALAYQVDEPLMPSTAAMIVLAHRQGRSDVKNPFYSYVCDARLPKKQDQTGDQATPKQCFIRSSQRDQDQADLAPQLCSIRNLAPEKLAM